MAFTTYTELQAEVADWLNRADLTTRIPGFITLCEAKMRRLVRRKTTRAALALDAAAETLPATVAELRSIRLNGSVGQQGNIAVITPEALADKRRVYTSAGIPRYASVIQGELLLVPTPDQEYASEIIYFAKLLPLATNTVNDELTEAPDIYLYGTLVEASAFLEHDARIPLWEKRFDAAVAELNRAREREEYGASLRPARLPVTF